MTAIPRWTALVPLGPLASRRHSNQIGPKVRPLMTTLALAEIYRTSPSACAPLAESNAALDLGAAAYDSANAVLDLGDRTHDTSNGAHAMSCVAYATANGALDLANGAHAEGDRALEPAYRVAAAH